MGVLILVPIGFGALMMLGLPQKLRHGLVVTSALLTMAAAVILATQGPARLAFPAFITQIGSVIEPLMAILILLISIKIRNRLVSAFAIIPLALTLYSFFTRGETAPEETTFVVDSLSLVMVLIVSVVGGLITLFSIGYMTKHAHHASPAAMTPGRFYFFLVAFLGLMNGLVLTDDLKWLTIFWEGTTLCSFFLIGYEGNEESKVSAKRAILINAFGGACLAVAAFLAEHHSGHGTLSAMIAGGSLLMPLALIAVATMTKSAQLPFQSWLLGAMVAPTPVSALLHSSTMVKAGSYLILRFAPAIDSTPLGTIVSIAGAFTFAAASAMAISQSNGKKVLAYSTIANLGLIAACAGIHSPLAFAAALTILIYHAISKALLFLCVGTIEQTIGSRHIEDMGGILFKMPLTTNVAIIGMASMMAPPFGMLIGKWMSIEASVNSPIVLLLLVAGSALTIFFWAKWLGRITTVSYHRTYTIEKVSHWMAAILVTMCAMVLAACLGAMPIYRFVIKPISLTVFGKGQDPSSLPLLDSVDAFLAWPLFVVLGAILLAIVVGATLFRKSHLRLPYLCGENVKTPESDFMFRSIADTPSRALLNSYYLSPIFGETRISAVCNPIATLIVITLFGVIFK
ncbi:MAG: proton-conducting transporter membrane subunit [bacterium]